MVLNISIKKLTFVACHIYHLMLNRVELEKVLILSILVVVQHS